MLLPEFATTVLRLLPVVLQALIGFVMVRRKLAGVFPVFFTYTVLVPAHDVALLFCRYPGAVYSRIYWWGEAGAILLGIGVVFEIIWHLVRPYSFLRALAFRLVAAVAIVALVFALMMLRFADGPTQADRILESIILLDRSARLLQVCLLITLTLLMSRLGLTWHHYSLGIAAGFAIYSALDLVLLELRVHLHVAGNSTFVLLRPLAYNFAAIIWCFYFVSSWAAKPVKHLPQTDLAQWNDALTEYMQGWYRRS
jgi:multisubunit Na+/H+ antiporter MnhF subunit